MGTVTTTNTSTVRVLLIDDHRILRQGLRALLEREPDFEVIGEAEDGRSGVEMAKDSHPDIILMDISMPALNGIDAARQILAHSPQSRIIALTAHSDRNLVREILKAGAVGYVVKDSAVEELTSAVRTVLAGRVYLSPRVAGLVVEGFVTERAAAAGIPAAGVFARLTAREREVLQLMAEGKATKEVAQALSVSVKTAETHRRAIMEKLDLHSVAELTKYAIREGLTSLEY
jgi:DNA-binding NarL/FixJ family response regulator